MEKYVKIVYQTEPIGPDKIILYLTTFDMKAFEKDQLMQKTKAIEIPIVKSKIAEFDYINYINDKMEVYVRSYLEPYVYEMKQIIENKKLESKIVSIPLKTKVKNITNSDDVHCDIVYGNITNCDNVYCTEIKGNVVNCNNIVYK